MIPTVGRVVLYTLSEQDAIEINRRRTTGKSIADRMKIDSISAWPMGAQAHIGNEVKVGQVYPMVIVRTWGDTESASVNGQVMLDGTDTFWATSRNVGDQPGQWQWPTIQK